MCPTNVAAIVAVASGYLPALRAPLYALDLAIVLAAAATRAWAQDAPTVPVRFGAHPTYDRLVVDWPAAVGYQVDQQGASATMTFGQAAGLD